MAKLKRKSNNNSGNLLQFIIGTIGITLFAIAIIGIKNECRDLQKYIDIRETKKSRLKNEIVLLESRIKDLTRPDRISKIVGDKFEMYAPAPESLIVVLKDNS
ncbi:MAG: hypothetical protein ISR90_04395 [Candidatus Marinimicrobia bacterium]|nr:hypothetical protein [Candidatus Neomarinimicrobiota bacterium]MBL7023277.1 hypothetical protein [Candidatus Neomarinimicrobiota bacterium]MBL7108871.1 hypothetical protein [Candidatus Neomarinimicrobiota bacterium]